jgi:D-amino peptidase
VRKIFIAADMEGCAGVSAPQALMPDRWAWEWSAARRWMTEEVLAVAEAAFDAQYAEVIVADGHGNAHNIDPDRLPDNVRLVRSWPRPLLHMGGVDDPDINACAFVGYHAGSTTPSSILAHSYSGAAFRWLRLNGELCSEGYLNAALAGEFGKPVILVSGDPQTVEDAQRYAPQAVCFVAKKSIGWRSQVSLPPAQVRRLLKEAAAQALSRPKPTPFVLQGPFHLEIEMTSQGAAEMLTYLPNVERNGAFGVAATFDRLSAVMRFVAFAMLYSPTGIPAL